MKRQVKAGRGANAGGDRALHATVQGLVQGVGFRYSAILRAKRLGLTGYVKNLPNGSVEVLAEGPTGELQQMLRWLERGPSAAVVRRVDHRYLPASGAYRGFTVEF